MAESKILLGQRTHALAPKRAPAARAQQVVTITAHSSQSEGADHYKRPISTQLKSIVDVRACGYPRSRFHDRAMSALQRQTQLRQRR